jgi:simple sugar transport system permease protein
VTAVTARVTPVANRASSQGFVRSHVGLIGVIVLILITSAVFTYNSPYFLEVSNILNIVRQQAPSFVIAVGLTFVITTKGIDLSVGSVAAMAGSAGAVVLATTGSTLLGVLAMLGIGAVAGLVNGWFIAHEKLPAFIVTLAGLTAYMGIALLITGGSSVLVTDEAFIWLGRGSIGDLSVPVLIAVTVTAVGWFLFTRTRFGMHVVAIGSNTVGARRSGVATTRVLMLVYLMSGVLAGLAGLIITARLAAGSSSTGQTLALEVVTGVVLGGTSLFGGRGSVIGSMLGVFLLGIISNGLTLLRFNPFYVPIVQGAILLVALWAQRKAGLQTRED